jgi:LysR family transcriptional activator of nhaA
MELTETGRMVYGYADEIFTLGRELLETVAGRGPGRRPRLVVGIADAVPKLVAYRILEPARRLPEPVTIVCLEDKPDQLLPELAAHQLDLVLADTPANPGLGVKAFSHLLGESGVTFFAPPAVAVRLRRGFPRSLTGQPMLLPGETTSLRRALDAWFEREGIRPTVMGEFEDPALLKVFGQAGTGVFPAPTAIEDDVRGQHRVAVVGRTDEARERFYAISVERKLKHPAVTAIVAAARERIFA